MADPAVIDAYLGGHHDAPLSVEEEEQQLAEIEEAVEREIAERQEKT
jgi:branched-chain amino acid transport system ATP-binding protein